MGIGSSTLQLRHPARFSISNLSITNYPSDGDCVAIPAALNIRYSDETADFTNNLGKPTEFVVDPDHNDFLLKIPYSDVIQFKFRLRIVPPVDSVTFISASSTKQLETFLSTELFHNPNIQNEDNVALLGDIKVTAEGGPGPRNVDFVWTWKADPASIHGTCGRKALCFAEYDKRDHKLSTLAAFSIWIEAPSNLDPPSPVNTLSPSSNTNSSLTNSHAPLSTNSYERTLSPPTQPVNIEKKVPDMNQQQLPSISTTATNNLASVSRHPSTVSSSVGSNFSTVSPLDTTRTAPEQFALSPSEAVQNSIDLATLPELPIGPPATHVITGESINRVLERERKVSSVPRPADPNSSSDQGMLEDGPLFRATVSSMEKKNSNLKVLIKKILKRSLLLFERQEALIAAMRMFDDSLKDASDNEIAGLQPLTQNYFNKSAPYNGLQDFLVINSSLLKMHVIEPLRRLYEQDIKTAELRKREFDDESQQYYSWLSRYLAMKQEAKGKKKSDSDSKYLDKRKAFELSRFDYYTFLSDLHGGRKQLDVIYHLGLYAESEVSNLFAASDNLKQKIKPDLDLIISEIREAHKDWSRYRTERELQRRNLEQPIRKTVAAQSSTIPPPMNTLTARNFSHEELSSEDDDELSLVTPTINKRATLLASATVTGPSRLPKLEDDTNNSFNNSELSDFGKLTVDTSSSRDTQNGSFATPITANNSSMNTGQDLVSTETIKSNSHRKEGLLWSMSRTGDPLANLNKAGWHKYWIVLAGGKLSEYTNWKQNLDLHNEPVNLKTACVREARSSDRRFCFEIVTPQFKRIYQATSDEDMRSWIRSIQNGINTSLHRDSVGGLSTDDNSSGSSAPTGAVSSKTDQNRSGLHRALNTSAASNSDSEDILKAIHHSPSNRQCADCGGTERVEWVSINLLVVLCIDCSGVHRSLGSHISKIRSLTLDTVSFTPELISLLKSVCNAQLNSVWEGELKQEKPFPLPNRLSFITEKYVEKKYIRPLERPNAELRKAVTEQDLIQILRALASRANPNATVTETTNNSPTEESISGKEIDKGIPLLLYAFKCAPKDSTIFPVVELLMLNGAQSPTETLPIPELSEAANKYLQKRQSQLSRKLTVNTSTPANNATSPNSSYVLSPDKKAGNMGAKLQKRLSTGFANR